MSKIRALLGGLAAIGALAAFVAVGGFSAHSAPSHVVVSRAEATGHADATQGACLSCVIAA